MARMICHREGHPMRASIVSMPSIRSILSIVLLAFASLALADEPAPEKETAPNFSLPDSNKGLIRVKWPREKPVESVLHERVAACRIGHYRRKPRCKCLERDVAESLGIAREKKDVR